MEEVREGLDETIEQFDDDDFAAAFRDLENEPGATTE
jgi:hypothetical protein